MAHTSWACQLNGLNNLFTLELKDLSMLCFAEGGERVTEQDLTPPCHLTVNKLSSENNFCGEAGAIKTCSAKLSIF